MYNPQIKNKWALVDLAKYGTRARKSIHSDVLIGEHPPRPIFKEGDLLDANATFNLIQDSYDQGRVYKILSSQIQQVEETVQANKEEVDEAINKLEGVGIEDIRTINSSIDRLNQLISTYGIELEQLRNKQQLDVTAINRELDAFAASNRFVYDGREENLFIIK